MCDIAMTGLGIQVGSSLLGALGTKQEAKAYADYQRKSAQAALDNYIYQSRALNNRYSEEEQASALEQQEIAIKNMKAKATAEASAASMGVQGGSLDNLFDEYERATAVSNYVAAKNLHWKGLQKADDLESMRIQALNSINLQQQYNGGSFGASLLAGIGQALTGYAGVDYRRRRLKQGMVN
jgi:hypothetical protein